LEDQFSHTDFEHRFDTIFIFSLLTATTTIFTTILVFFFLFAAAATTITSPPLRLHHHSATTTTYHHSAATTYHHHLTMSLRASPTNFFLADKVYNRNLHGAPEKLARRQYINLRPSIRGQGEAYQRNLRLLYQEFQKKFSARIARTGDAEKAGDQIDEDVWDAVFRLEDFVGGRAPEPYREGYLTEIFRHWRTVAPADEARRYEDVWVWVAGRPRRQE
jgi:hypothetical protein